MKTSRTIEILYYFVFGILIILVAFPILFVFLHSFGQENSFSFVPDTWTLQNWKQILLYQSGYLLKFWKSLGVCGVIVIGQVLVSLCAAMAFAKYRFPGRNILYFLMVILMMMPIQVTLVPNYIILKAMGLLGTWWALILPAVFSSFGTVFLTQVIRSIPDEVMEAAKIDGAGVGTLCVKIIIPFVKSGIASLAILTFVEAWNMVEQPMIFLENVSDYPLSVFLASVQNENVGQAFACGILTLVPVLLLYLYFKDDLQKGLEFMGVK